MTDYCLSPERAKLAEQIPAMLGGRSAKNQPELSRAVAQVLAFVFQLKHKRAV